MWKLNAKNGQLDIPLNGGTLLSTFDDSTILATVGGLVKQKKIIT